MRRFSKMYGCVRWVAPAVLLVLVFVIQVLMRMPPKALDLGRWLLAPHLLIAAAILWPVWFAQGRTSVKTCDDIAALSVLTVLISLFAVPLWAGHSCWAPEQVNFVLLLFLGLTLGAIFSLKASRLAEVSEQKMGLAAAIFLLTFFCSIAITLVAGFRERAGAAPPTEAKPQLAWKRTPLQGLWAYLAPRPWFWVNYAPVEPAVGDGWVVFIGLPGRVDFLDAADGRTVRTVEIEPPGPFARDAARNAWERPLVLRDKILLRDRGASVGYLLDPRTGQVERINLDLRLLVAVVPDLEGGFYALSLEGLERLDSRSKLRWSCRPDFLRQGHEHEVVPSLVNEFSVNECSPLHLHASLVSTARGVVCLHPAALWVSDPETGTVRWHVESRGRFAGMQVSPRQDTVYVVDSGAGAKRVTAFTLDGFPRWHRELPAECFGLTWVATPEGILMAPRHHEVSTAEFVGLDGITKYSLALPGAGLYCFYYLEGILLVAGINEIRAYHAEDGHLLWSLPEPGGAVSLGGYEYFDLVPVGNTLVVPYGGGIGAHDLATGRIKWFYKPPGGFLSMAAGTGDMLYVTSSRGIFAVRCR